jgi:hypothetical protein
MTTKDWLILLIPICFNGVIIFALQKVFEKKQIERTWKVEYLSTLVKKIDDSLELHAAATKLATEGDSSNGEATNTSIREYFDNSLSLYYYYVQNKNIFGSMEDKFENLATQIMELSKAANDSSKDTIYVSSLINDVRDTLIEIKDMCIKL